MKREFVILNIAIFVAITLIVIFAPGYWKWMSVGLLMFVHYNN